MNDTSKFNAVVSFLWAIADLLNGAFKKKWLRKTEQRYKWELRV